MNCAKCVLGTFAAAMLSSTAMAGFVVEDIPAWRGAADTAYYNWETFTSADSTQPNFPNNEAFPSGSAVLFNFGSDAIITGAGNIYGYGGALNIHTYGYADSDIQEAVFNFATMGTEINYDGAMIAWTGANGEQGLISNLTESINYYEEVDFGQGPGSIVNVSWSIDLSSVDADVREIGMIWQSDTVNISLNTVSMDLRFGDIPAPGALALLGIAGLAGRRRRR